MENKKEQKRIRLISFIYLLLSIIFLLCVVIQVFIAGLAIFVNPAHWVKHMGFVHIFEFVPILMFILTFIGKLPRSAMGQSAALFGIIFVMYFTANITAILPWAAALHPVIAIILFWMSIRNVSSAWRLIKEEK